MGHATLFDWSASNIPTLNFARGAKFRMGHRAGAWVFLLELPELDFVTEWALPAGRVAHSSRVLCD